VNLLRLGALTALAGAGLAAPLPFARSSDNAAQAGPTTKTATVREGTSMAVALSPDRRTLVIDLQGSLWALPIEGGEARRLTDEYLDARQPAWSPDGRRIAFQGYRDGTWRIWTIDADGGNPAPLTSGPFDDREPHWSQDGATIAFSSDRSGNYDIWLLNVATGATSRLTSHAANEFWPAWSPDGREVAYVSDRRPGTGVFASSVGGAERTLAPIAGTLSAPSWRPDRSELFYTTTANGIGKVMLGAAELSADEDPHPFRAQWLSNDEVVYTGNGRIRRRTLSTGRLDTIAFSATLTVSPARGTYTRQARDVDTTTPQPALGIIRPVLSKDGRQLAFAALGDIWLMPLGSPARRLTDDEFSDTDPAWSPDGRQLAYVSDRAGGMDVWVHDFGQRTHRRLTQLPDAEMAPTWSPDGRHIAFVSNTGFEQGTIYVIEARGGVPLKVYDESFGPGYPTWSPDGRHVAISTLQPYSSRFREGMNATRVVTVDGGHSRIVSVDPQLPMGKRSGDGPAWSPDGRQMAYVSNGALHVVPVAEDGTPNGPARRLVDELADAVSWANAREVLYIATDRVKVVSTVDGRVRDIPIDVNWEPVHGAGTTVVHAGRLVDMTSPQARTDVDIVIEGHRIARVEPHRDELHRGRIVDATGLTVMPGLIEGHGHLSKEHGGLFGRAHLAWGITSVRSPGGSPYESLEERESIEAGRRPGPRLFIAGYLLDGIRPYYPMASTAPSEAVVDMEVERARRLGFDLLKTYVRLPDLLQRHAVLRAHAIGIPLSSHEIYPAARSGMDSVEHLAATSRRGYTPKQSLLGVMYEDVERILATADMTLTPTVALGGFARALAAEPALREDPRTRTLQASWALTRMQAMTTPADPVVQARTVARVHENLRRLHAAGVRLIAGVDSPLMPYGIALHTEIQAYQEAGLSPFEALRTATVNPAGLLNADLGTIEPGQLADLIVVEGDPLKDVRAARNVRRVIRDGIAYELADLLRRP
jgi:Tol biopolymer transport system component/imidazolonepropionase-like amidohydrolase